MAKREVQMELPVTPGWGGRRRGAGRPPGPNAGTPHVERPELKARHPVHVTLRVASGLPSLRAKAQFRIVKEALRGIRRRFAFRVVHYSVQSNHLHLVCEAHDKESLGRGLKGLQGRIAKALNRLLGRRGAVFPTRYHARILETPREVRNVLMYVLNNARHHTRRVLAPSWTDPCSSAESFNGWKGGPSHPPRAAELAAPLTWLLKKGWRKNRLLRPNEVPGPAWDLGRT